VTVNEHELEMILKGARRSSAVFRMALDGGNGVEQTMLRAVDRHPVTSRLVHMDFLRIDVNKPVEFEVSLHQIGNIPKGVRAGGVLEHIQRTVTIRCKPLEMPSRIDVDLSELDMHQNIHVSDLKLPEGVAVVDDPHTSLYSVVPPTRVVEETPAEGEAGATTAEPEVLTRKKEADAAPAKPAGK
jgi:large subunit ribosomal protein L25